MLPTVRRGVRNIWDDPTSLVQREFDRVFNRMLGSPQAEMTAAYPVDIREDENCIYVEAELPGFKKDEINITLEQGILSITAERKIEPAKKGETHLSERSYTRVARSFSLPTTVDENKVDAKLEDGVLSLKLNKREEVKPRRIELK